MSEKDIMSQEMYIETRVIELEPLGFGNPESTIRYERHEDDVELMREMKDATAEIIESGSCVVDVNEADDGCIDGRTAVEVTYIDMDGIERTVTIEVDEDHERQKVAGGGYITALAMELAIHPPSEGVEVMLQHVIGELAKHGIFCGVHTGSHGKPELGQTDCGANDKVETILENGILYKDQIAPNVRTIIETAGATYNESAQDNVNAGWVRALSDRSFFAGSTGTTRSSLVSVTVKTAQEALESEKPLSVSKELAGDHNERFVVVIFQEGKTFSQKKLRDELKLRFPDVDEKLLPQVFVVDAPRIVKLAMNLTDNEREQQVALQAGVSYQLATAATLTDGSLRMFAVK